MGGPGHARTAVVVEDDGFVRELLTDALADAGYSVTAFADGLAALTAIESASPLELLVVDIGLPRVNGRAIAQAAMSLNPRIGVILITGDQEFRIDAGPRVARLGKPFTRAEFIGAIQTLRPR